ncbi:lantibiotic dehydratase [Glycomyces harbinensis]|nr:lantibiotic dehydratase [Glycomyces harbinensis]
MTEPTSGGRAFAAADFFMVRAPLLPADALWPDRPAPSGPPDLDSLRAEGRRTLRELAAEPRIRQALHAASPSLYAGLTDGRTVSEKRRARSDSTLLRYLSRMSARPTPLGLFAGVGMGRFGSRTALGLAADPVARTRTRADSGWLLHLIAGLERDPSLRDALPLRRNDLLYRVGDRAVLPRTRTDHSDDQRVDLRLTAPADRAVRLAATGLDHGDLVADLLRAFPGAGEDRIRALLAQLWDLNILGSDLRPPCSAPFPERHLADRLDRSPATAAAAADLREAAELLGAVDDANGRADVSVLDKLTESQRRLTPAHTGPTYQTDTVLDLTGAALPAPIAEAAAEAAELLLRLGGTVPRPDHIAAYHHMFLEHYGAGTEIPLLDVLSPEKGIDAPNSFVSPVRSAPLPTFARPTPERRDRALVRLLSGALRDGRRTVDLNDDDVEDLTVWRPDHHTFRVPPSLDVYFQIAAASADAVDAGDWSIVLNTAGMFKGLQSFGRFADLFGDDHLADLRGFAAAEEAALPDAIVAELNCEPAHARGGNLVVRPPVRGYEVSVNAAPTLPADRQIALDEIMLGATGDRFYLWSPRHGRELLVVQSQAYTRFMAANACRALLELSADGLAPPARFDWSIAEGAPFLPRLTRGRIVLSPAQWHLDEAALDRPADPDACYTAVQRWREAWQVPARVRLAAADRRLLLDLDHPLCTDELHREIAKNGAVTLQEVLPDTPDLWLRDTDDRRFHAEFVLPVRARSAIETREPIRTDPRGPAPARRLTAGSEWTHLKLYAASDRHADLLTGPVAELAQELRDSGAVDRWFYIRYFDPLPHLRLRFHAAAPDVRERISARLAAWSGSLVASEAAFDTALVSYDRETHRYGGPDAIEMLEMVFAANSDTCVQLMRLAAAHDDLEPELLGALALQRLCADWGADADAIAVETLGQDVSEAGRSRFRTLRPLLCELTAPGQPGRDPRAARYRPFLDAVFERQAPVLADAGRAYRALADRGGASRSERNLLESLMHMQCNRLLGADRTKEETARELWALAHRAIRGRPAPSERQ